MSSRDKKSVLAALDEVRGKPSPGQERSPQDCGDIGLKIGRDGTWYYQNTAIERKALVRLFASVLRQDDDGRYCLVTPAERVLVGVEEAPFLAVGMDVEGRGRHQRLTFRTNIDEVVEAGAGVGVDHGQGGRIARPVYYELVVAAVSEDRGCARELGVWSGGTFFPFPVPRGSGED